MFFRRVFKNDNSQTFSAPANSRNTSGAGNSANNNSDGLAQHNNIKNKSDNNVNDDGQGKKVSRRAASDEKPKGLTILQLTPLWEHIIRTRTLPEGLSINAMFEEFYERLHDPEWQVRQHALRVLVDVLSVMRQNSDMYISRLIVPLVENLGHSTPAVRKGALDAFKVYLGETRIPDTVIHEVINIGMDQKFTSDFGGRLAAGVILALPSLVQPTLISIKRAAILKLSLNALAGKMLQVTYQEVALKSIIKIRDMISQRDFMECMPFKAKRDFDILCNVYGLQGSPTNLRDSGIDLNVPSSSESKNSWQYYHRGQPAPNEMILPQQPPPPQLKPNVYTTASNYENQLNLWKFNYVNQPQQQPPPLHIQLIQQPQPLLPTPPPLPPPPIPPPPQLANINAEILQDTWQYKNLISKTNSIMEMRTENNENRESRKIKPKPPPIEQVEEMVMVEAKKSNENYSDEISSMQMMHYSPPEAILNANPEPAQLEVKLYNHSSPVKSPKKGTPKKEKLPHHRPYTRNSHSAYQRKNKSPTRRSRSATPTPSPRPIRTSSAESFMKSASDTEGTEPDINLTVSSFFQRKESDEIGPGDKIIMETEIKLSETTAVTMRILESQISQETEDSEEEHNTRSSNKSLQRSDSIMRIFNETEFENNAETDDATPRTPRRVRFGGEIIKMRTPDSDALTHSDADENNRNHSRSTSNETVSKDKIINIPIEKTQTLQIEITNDNTKPVLPVRPKTAASPSRKYTTQNSEPIAVSPTHENSRKTRSPNRNEKDMLKPRSRSISPSKQKRRMQNRIEDILSPIPQHHEVQVLHNLIRSPLNSPNSVRQIPPAAYRKNSITSVTSETQTDDTAKNSLSPVERGTVQTQTSIESPPSPKRTVDLVSTSTSTGSDMEQYSNNSYIDNLRSGGLTHDTMMVKLKRWEELGLVTKETLADLKSGDWRLRSRAICALEDALRDSDNLGKVQPCLDSLFKTLLSSEKHPDVLDDKRRVIINLISRLPLDNLENRVGQLVTGLCRQGGAGSNRVAKTLMQRLPPAAIVLRLLSDEFVHARSARFRENALQMVLYALMTFPSTYFDISTCVRRATKAAIDRKKRVRQAALDVLAVLGQISSPKTVIEVVNSVVEHRQDGEHLTAAVKARLSRKQLPIVGCDGSVQYTLRIPSPQSNMPTHVFGADVEWIIAGSGSVSPTSLTKRTMNLNHTSQVGQPAAPDTNRYLEYSNFNSNNNIINTSNRFGRRAPHEMLAIGVGVKNIDDKDMYSSGNWRKFTGYQADDDKNSQFIVATALPVQLSSAQQQQQQQKPPPTPQQQPHQQQQMNMTGAQPPQPLCNMKLQSRSVPELSTSGNTSGTNKKTINSSGGGNGNNGNGNGNGRPSKIPVTTMSRFPAMENNNGTLKSSMKNGSMQNLALNSNTNPQHHNPTINGHPTIYKSFSVQKLNGIPPKSISNYNANMNNNGGNYGMHPESLGSLMKQSSLEDTRLPSRTTSEYNMINNNNNGYFTSSKQGFQILSSNKYYQQTNETTPQHQQSNEKSSNRPSPEILSNPNSNTNSRGSSSNKSIYSLNNNNSNEQLSIHNDSNSSDVHTDSDSDNSTPTRVIGTSDPVINVQKIENLIQQKSPSSISRPHSVLGNTNIDNFQNIKRPKTANIINFDDIPIKSRTISIDNIPLNEDITSIKSETLSIENIPFDEIPIKSKTPSHENVSNLSRSSSIIQDPFCRTETPTPHDIDEISSNSVGTRSDTDYEDDTTNTKSKTEMSDSFTPKSNGTAKSSNSADMNSDKIEYSEMVDEDFIKPTIKSPQRKLKPVIFRSKKVAPAKQAAAQKTKQTENYTTSSLSRRFERPRDALNQCIIQLESQNWETTMNGIHLFVRLMRHHPEHIEPQIHLLAAHLAKHIKNLRSQVARAACQAAGEFFATYRKYLDQETEDLVTNLLHRTADTNKFLRADAGRALDSMVDNMQPSKIIHIVSTRGTAHPNAVVRTSAAKLFNRLVSRLGCDKVFAMSKDCRDKLILNTAQLLQEGSLETRNYAKDIFKQLSAHNNYSKVLFDVIPQRIYRNIEKTLKNIK